MFQTNKLLENVCKQQKINNMANRQLYYKYYISDQTKVKIV